MLLLLDANCWLQIVRNRPHADDVRRLLAGVSATDVKITDMAVHSIAIVMGRFKTLDDFPQVVRDFGIGPLTEIIRLGPSDYRRVVEVAQLYRLDFDDAYQYAAAELRGLTLVSLDADFDRTPRGRLTPAAALAQYSAGQGTP
jgi:predicted nucleic acid-binding protein